MTRPPRFAWHPFLLALYPILLAYSRNTDSVYFRETLGVLATVLVGTLATDLILLRVVRDPLRAGLLVSAGLLAAFSFERNVHFAEVRGWGTTAGAREWLVLGGELASFGAWARFLCWRRAPIGVLTTTANAAAVALLGFLIPGLARTLLTADQPASARRGAPSRPGPAAPGAPPARRPDIYFIVLDAYGRSDVLRSMYDWDNRGFLDRMQRRGFYLAERSTANYCQTALSITATLDGRYHDRPDLQDAKSRLPLRDLIRDTEFGRILREQGYQLVGCASGFGLTDGFPADRRLAPRPDLGEFAALVLDMTPTWTLLGRGAGRASHQRHRARIDYLFDHLPELADDPAPTFCLAHVLSPHPPFVFDSRGGDVSDESTTYRLTDGKAWSNLAGHGGPEDYARHYRAQAAYITTRVEEVVESILARSARPPVIVVQGDHGPGSHFDSDLPEPNDLAERFGILNLCSIPGVDAARLSPTMTPINTFRIVADAVFGTGRGLLPDRNFYSSYQTPYRMIEVTSDLADPILAPVHESGGESPQRP